MALRRQLEAMPDGGVYAITIPKAPYRCPPGPYERACQVAWYFKTEKPKSKVLILDANEKVQSKEALFTKVWNEWYPGIIEYRPNSTLVDVDAETLTAKLEFEDVKADVLNVVPPQRAGKIAADTGLITANNKWGGWIFSPMSQWRKRTSTCSATPSSRRRRCPSRATWPTSTPRSRPRRWLRCSSGEAPNPNPVINNTCYSFVSDKQVIHVASVHRYDPEKKTMVVAPGASGVSAGAERAGGDLCGSVGQQHLGRHARVSLSAGAR